MKMRTPMLFLGLVVSLNVLLSSCAILSPQRALENALHKEIDKMVNLLEVKKYKEMIDGFVDKNGLADMNLSGMLNDQLLDRVLGKKRAAWITQLKTAKKLAPAFSNGNTKASFKHPSFKKDLLFNKKEDKWLLDLTTML